MIFFKNLSIIIIFNQFINFLLKLSVNSQFSKKNSFFNNTDLSSFKHAAIANNLKNYWQNYVPLSPISFESKGICQGLNYIYLHDYFYSLDQGIHFLEFFKKLEHADAPDFLKNLFQEKEKMVQTLQINTSFQFRKRILKKLEHSYRDIAYIDQLLWHYAPSYQINTVNIFNAKRSRSQLLKNYGFKENTEAIFIFDLQIKQDRLKLLDLIAPLNPSAGLLVNGIYEFTTWDHSLLFKVDDGKNILFDANGGFYNQIEYQYDHLSHYKHRVSGYLVLHILKICKKIKDDDQSCQQPLFSLEDSFKKEIALIKKSASLKDIDKKYRGELILLNLMISESYSLLNNYLDDILDLGIDIDADPDFDGVTALSLACLRRHLPVIERLINAGSSVNKIDSSGSSLLMAMTMLGFTDVINLLIKKGADLNFKNKNANQALHLAFMHHQEDAALLLIKKGADINAQGFEGMTPLHLAIKNQDVDSINILITQGANINFQNNLGKTPCDLARENFQQSIEIITLLESAQKRKSLRF